MTLVPTVAEFGVICELMDLASRPLRRSIGPGQWPDFCRSAMVTSDNRAQPRPFGERCSVNACSATSFSTMVAASISGVRSLNRARALFNAAWTPSSSISTR